MNEGSITIEAEKRPRAQRGVLARTVSTVRLATTAAAVSMAGVMVAAGPAGAVSAPNPPPAPPPGLDATANTFLGWLKWGGLVCGVLGLGICGIMMMVGRRNRSSTAVDGASGIPWVLGGLTVMSFASAIVGQVLT